MYRLVDLPGSPGCFSAVSSLQLPKTAARLVRGRDWNRFPLLAREPELLVCK